MFSTWMRWFPFHSQKKKHKHYKRKKIVIWTLTMCKALHLQKQKMDFFELYFFGGNPFYELGKLMLWAYNSFTALLLYRWWLKCARDFSLISSSLPPYPFFISILFLSHAIFLYFFLQQFLMLILWMWKYDEWYYNL